MTKLVVLALAVWLGVGVLIAQSEDSIKAKNLKEVVVDATYNSADVILLMPRVWNSSLPANRKIRHKMALTSCAEWPSRS